MGRPTDYSEEMNAKALAYIQGCVDEYTEYHKTRGEKSDTFDRLVRVKLPTIEGLAVFLGVHRDTLYAWEATHPDFSDTLEQLRALQAERLINGSLSGDYNPVISKLMLSSNHGMREKSDVTTNNKELPTPILSPINVHPHDRDEEGSGT